MNNYETYLEDFCSFKYIEQYNLLFPKSLIKFSNNKKKLNLSEWKKNKPFIMHDKTKLNGNFLNNEEQN